jgi:hypothetical protein
VKKQGVWNIIAVYLDINKNECMNRVMSRKKYFLTHILFIAVTISDINGLLFCSWYGCSHPTLPATEKAKVIVDEFYDQLQKPTLSEGFRESKLNISRVSLSLSLSLSLVCV